MLQRIKHKVGNYLPALRSYNYRLYFFGQGISLVGTWLQTVAEQWLIYPVLTNNKSLLGIVSAINLAPTMVIVLFAGVLADRIHKRNAFMLFQILYALIALMMSFLIFSKQIQIWHVFVAALFTGIVFAFDNPTRQSFIIDLVERKDLPSALSLSSGIFNGARALGPALAGILIATSGIAAAYFLNSLSFLAVIISLLLMRLPPHVPHKEETTIFEGFKEGVTYLKQNKVFAVLFALIGSLTLFTWPGATLLPVFAHDIFKTGEMGFGLLQSSFGVGAIIGALAFAKVYEINHNKLALLLTTIFLVVLSVMTLALTPFFWLAVLANLVSGWAVTTTFSTANTLIQLNIPAFLRGRMMSFYAFMLIGGMPIGALLASLGVATIGARLTVFVSAVFFALVSSLIIWVTKDKLAQKLQNLS